MPPTTITTTFQPMAWFAGFDDGVIAGVAGGEASDRSTHLTVSFAFRLRSARNARCRAPDDTVGWYQLGRAQEMRQRRPVRVQPSGRREVHRDVAG